MEPDSSFVQDPLSSDPLKQNCAELSESAGPSLTVSQQNPDPHQSWSPRGTQQGP